MSKHPVITIGRQCGSSGKIIGQKLAEELGIKCYDKELLAPKNSGLSEELFESHDEKPTSSFLYSLVMDTYSLGFTTSGYMDMPINHKLFLAQFETIKELAMKEPCIIVGRCADYALSDYPNLISVFISAKDEDKIKSLKELYQIDDAKAKDLMVKTDKQRSSYYSVGVDGAVKVIKCFIEEKMSRLS